MKFKGKATPKKGVDKGIIHWKSLIVTNKYFLKIRALYYIIIIWQLLLLMGYLPYC
jgi:hypothetical protein